MGKIKPIHARDRTPKLGLVDYVTGILKANNEESLKKHLFRYKWIGKIAWARYSELDDARRTQLFFERSNFYQKKEMSPEFAGVIDRLLPFFVPQPLIELQKYCEANNMNEEKKVKRLLQNTKAQEDYISYLRKI